MMSDNGWRPIETAPKDGTPVLLCMEYRVPWMKVEIKYGYDTGYWTDMNGGGWVTARHGKPILWQPLPPLPSPPKETP